MTDPIADFKARQRESGASFAPLEMLTMPSGGTIAFTMWPSELGLVRHGYLVTRATKA